MHWHIASPGHSLPCIMWDTWFDSNRILLLLFYIFPGVENIKTRKRARFESDQWDKQILVPQIRKYNKANLRDLIAATGIVILLKLDLNCRCFSPCDLEIDGWPRKIIGHLFSIASSFVHHRKPLGEFKLELLSGNAQFGSKSAIYCPVWPRNLTDDLEINRAPLLCCFKFCASFHSRRCIQTKVTVWKHSIWVKIGNSLSRMTLKFDGWPWKTLGHLFYVASSFMHHFIAIGEFKLKLHSGNAQFGSKSMILLAVWPWNLTDDLKKQ